MQIMHGFLWLPRNGIRLNKEMRNEMDSLKLQSLITGAIESLTLSKDEGDFPMESYFRGRLHAYASVAQLNRIQFNEEENYHTF
jgi:hypothetical protein